MPQSNPSQERASVATNTALILSLIVPACGPTQSVHPEDLTTAVSPSVESDITTPEKVIARLHDVPAECEHDLIDPADLKLVEFVAENRTYAIKLMSSSLCFGIEALKDRGSFTDLEAEEQHAMRLDTVGLALHNGAEGTEAFEELWYQTNSSSEISKIAPNDKEVEVHF